REEAQMRWQKLSDSGLLRVKEAWDAVQMSYRRMSNELAEWETDKLASVAREKRIMDQRITDLVTFSKILDKLEKSDKRKGTTIIISGLSESRSVPDVRHIVGNAGYKAIFLGNKEELY